MKGTTSTGFNFEINERILKDYRFTLKAKETERGNDSDKVCAMVEMTNALLGDDGEAALCEHVKEADGIIPTEKVFKEVAEIINLARAELKNS